MPLEVYKDGAWELATAFRRRENGVWRDDVLLDRWDGEEWQSVWPGLTEYVTDYPMTAYAIFLGTNQGSNGPLSFAVGYNGTYQYSLLMWFPTATMREELTGARIVEVRLNMRRLSVNQGADPACFIVGRTLCGLEPTGRQATWDSSEHVPLCDAELTIRPGETKRFVLDNSAVTALLSGEADALCLPALPKYSQSPTGYILFDSSKAFLRVKYLK